ncbi:response regulator [Chlorobaculum thiosulfatiphilum]|uniref:histidine kinase n=1 Tax=Chlorobaculum thiosulfatiphilum TaxID=115852 RepID=A0A5C4SAF4_CHLTI|nr:ATP-binding protein [Chlorobaculum thiosulfatiphilum]TNJ40416.1 response regulator [Chlorobaculum thiosulfatiphilum]
MTQPHQRQKYSEKASLFKLILENAGDVLWIYDFRENRYTYASPSVHLLRGFNPDEVEQQTLYEALSPESAAKAEALVKQRIKDIESGDLSARFGVDEFEQFRKDGSTVMTEVMTTFIIDDTDEVTGIVGIARDISKRLEKEHSRKELEKKLYETQKYESINRVVCGVAHEINNTLMPVSGYAELLEELFQDNNESLEYCREICQSANKAARLIDKLIDYTGSQYLNLQYVDLNQAIVDIEQLLRSSIKENIIIKRIHDGSYPCVKIDLDKLRQIVFGLAFNAQDAMRDGGALIIDIKTVMLDKKLEIHQKIHEGSYAQLIISDTGTGIDPTIMPKIFEPFFTTKNFGMASGLGLSAIFGIVKQHNGNIEVKSTVSKGTSVSIVLPLHENHQMTSPAKDENKHFHKNENKTIMLVEDDEDVRNLLHEMLSLQEHTLLLASNPMQAFEIAKQHDGFIDLLITDIIMPGMNGKQLADKLKNQHPAMSFIFMSGYNNEIVKLPLKSHFIQKPFSFMDFIHVVQQSLEH